MKPKPAVNVILSGGRYDGCIVAVPGGDTANSLLVPLEAAPGVTQTTYYRHSDDPDFGLPRFRLRPKWRPVS
jgi:hypothetical protein